MNITTAEFWNVPNTAGLPTFSYAQLLAQLSQDINGGGGAAETVQANKTGTTNRNNTTTLADDPDLTFTGLESGYIYEMQAILDVTCLTGADGDFKFDWNTLTAVRGVCQFNQDGVGNATPTTLQMNRGTPNVVLVTNPNAPGRVVVSIHGYVLQDAETPQDLALEWAQNTSSANNTQLNTGSYIKLTKIGQIPVGG